MTTDMGVGRSVRAVRRMTPRCSPLFRSAVVAVIVVALASACSSSGDAGSAHDQSSPSTVAPPADQRGPQVTSPTVTGPITGGTPFLAMSPDLANKYGYVEQEFFLDGEATAYDADGPLAADGHWSVTPSDTAHYRTRILVRRPADPQKFDGTVFVEWFNVTGGLDNDPDFGLGNPAILDDGSAYVGVSAQKVGVEGGGSAIPIQGAPAQIPGLKQTDPERYGSLVHPGDQYSYDIFSQAAQAIRRPGDVDVLGGLVPQHLIAMGESQSAARLVTYVDAVHPVADIYDGFLIHSRGGGGTPLMPDGEAPGNGAAHIRDDLDVPVLQFETETDAFGSLGFAAAQQDDSDTLRTWEVAGTAHADQSILDYNAGLATSFGLDLSQVCPVINDGPMAEVLRAALAAVRTWVVDGEPAPTAPRFEVAGGSIARNDLGVAVGGIRTPPVDAPVVVLSGEPVPGTSVLCSLFGNMTPIPPAQLSALYPTHQDYVDVVTSSANAAVRSGFLLQADADAYVAQAQDAPVPS